MPRVRVMQLEAAARMERLANKLSAGSFFPAQSLVRIKARGARFVSEACAGIVLHVSQENSGVRRCFQNPEVGARSLLPVQMS